MKLNVVIGLVVQDGKVLICQRPQELDHGHQWEFPGGKIEPGETPTEALSRELFEEIGIRVVKSRQFSTTEHQYAQKYITFECFFVTQFSGTPYQKEGQPQMKWVRFESLYQYQFPEANHTIIDQILSLLSPFDLECAAGSECI